MPELPEVETARKLIHSKCLKRKVTFSDIPPDDIIFKNNTEVIRQHLAGNVLLDTGRHGKYFILFFEKPPHLVCHLGMTGNVKLSDGSSVFLEIEKKRKDTSWPPRFTKMELTFEDVHNNNTIQLAFTDPRRLSRVRLVQDPLTMEPISKLGFDPLINPPTDHEFYDKAISRRVPIKSLLLDQAFSAGVGNWIADEILYQSRIHPSQYSNTLSFEQTTLILDKMKHICKTAVSLDANYKLFPTDWMFLYRWNKGKKGLENVIDGKKIDYVTVGGRTSAIVPTLQIVTKGQEVLKPVKIKKVAKKKANPPNKKFSEAVTSKSHLPELQLRRSVRILARKLG